MMQSAVRNFQVGRQPLPCVAPLTCGRGQEGVRTSSGVYSGASWWLGRRGYPGGGTLAAAERCCPPGCIIGALPAQKLDGVLEEWVASHRGALDTLVATGDISQLDTLDEQLMADMEAKYRAGECCAAQPCSAARSSDRCAALLELHITKPQHNHKFQQSWHGSFCCHNVL